jgi:hypothetical protein
MSRTWEQAAGDHFKLFAGAFGVSGGGVGAATAFSAVRRG